MNSFFRSFLSHFIPKKTCFILRPDVFLCTLARRHNQLSHHRISFVECMIKVDCLFPFLGKFISHVICQETKRSNTRNPYRITMAYDSTFFFPLLAPSLSQNNQRMHLRIFIRATYLILFFLFASKEQKRSFASSGPLSYKKNENVSLFFFLDISMSLTPLPLVEPFSLFFFFLSHVCCTKWYSLLQIHTKTLQNGRSISL